MTHALLLCSFNEHKSYIVFKNDIRPEDVAFLNNPFTIIFKYENIIHIYEKFQKNNFGPIYQSEYIQIENNKDFIFIDDLNGYMEINYVNENSKNEINFKIELKSFNRETYKFETMYFLTFDILSQIKEWPLMASSEFMTFENFSKRHNSSSNSSDNEDLNKVNLFKSMIWNIELGKTVRQSNRQIIKVSKDEMSVFLIWILNENGFKVFLSCPSISAVTFSAYGNLLGHIFFFISIKY